MRDVLLIDDDRRFSELVVSILANKASVRLAASGVEARAQVAAARPHAVLIDLGLPDCEGIELVSEFASAGLGPVLVLTGARASSSILGAMRAGADGYLLKEDLATGLLPALEELWRGGAPLSSAAARVLVTSMRRVPRPLPSGRALSRREEAVLRELARGLTYDQVASALSMSVNTVRTHVKSIYEKLQASTRTEALKIAHDFGLLDE